MAKSQGTAAPDVGRAVSAIRAELARLRAGLGHVEQLLDELGSGAPSAGGGVRERPERYLRVLVEVYERGGHHGVNAERLAEIGARYGYDRRGLGGFFTGARAPLGRNDEQIRLTPHGTELMDAYLAQTPP